MSQAKHSRRIVPITRSHTALAFGLWSGDFTQDRDCLIQVLREDVVVVVNEIPVALLVANCLAQLLQR